MVRLQSANSCGQPLDIWCFTATTQWDEYEGIRSAVLEHLNTVIGDFAGLGIYTSSSLTVDLDNPATTQSATSTPSTVSAPH